MKSVELLAPAGNMIALHAAVSAGADAVYLGASSFNARRSADNFTLETLREACDYAHLRGVKVYLTVNTIILPSELYDALELVRQAYRAGVDAFIVSDLGVFALAREHAPQVDLHVSTQASVSNVEAARMWHRLGAKRIVTAREMSLAEIAQLKAELPDVEVEVFVQGAMCMAISGRCLISDYLTGRSANQGNCVQPCRWSYHLEEQTRPGELFPIEEDERGTYIMNSKDLNMLAHLDELIAAGVDSIKIEGRVKKAFYVATVVNAYRQVLDGGDPVQWGSELERISHRPYSTGFFYGDAQQSFEDDIYVQLYDWVAEVVESRPIEATATENDLDLTQGMWQTIVYCRNRFYEGDTLELLSPHREVTPVLVVGLEEVFPVVDARDDEGLDNPEPKDASASKQNERCFDSNAGAVAIANTTPVEVANKAMGAYAFITPMPLHRYDILRAKRRDPSKKN